MDHWIGPDICHIQWIGHQNKRLEKQKARRRGVITYAKRPSHIWNRLPMAILTPHDGVHVPRVAADLRFCRAPPKEGLYVQVGGPFFQILQYQDCTSVTRHGVPGKLHPS